MSTTGLGKTIVEIIKKPIGKNGLEKTTTYKVGGENPLTKTEILRTEKGKNVSLSREVEGGKSSETLFRKDGTREAKLKFDPKTKQYTVYSYDKTGQTRNEIPLYHSSEKPVFKDLGVGLDAPRKLRKQQEAETKAAFNTQQKGSQDFGRSTQDPDFNAVPPGNMGLNLEPPGKLPGGGSLDVVEKQKGMYGFRTPYKEQTYSREDGTRYIRFIDDNGKQYVQRFNDAGQREGKQIKLGSQPNHGEYLPAGWSKPTSASPAARDQADDAASISSGSTSTSSKTLTDDAADPGKKQWTTTEKAVLGTAIAGGGAAAIGLGVTAFNRSKTDTNTPGEQYPAPSNGMQPMDIGNQPQQQSTTNPAGMGTMPGMIPSTVGYGPYPPGYMPY